MRRASRCRAVAVSCRGKRPTRSMRRWMPPRKDRHPRLTTGKGGRAAMSHTAIMLIVGIALLILLRLAMPDSGAATRRFVWLWLLISIGNLFVGVLYAGYGLGEEAVVWLLVFGVPAALAFATRTIQR